MMLSQQFLPVVNPHFADQFQTSSRPIMKEEKPEIVAHGPEAHTCMIQAIGWDARLVCRFKVCVQGTDGYLYPPSVKLTLPFLLETVVPTKLST